jgi:hypothetical protein
VKRRQETQLADSKFLGGDPEGKIGNSAEFRDIYEVTNGSRPWLVTDPPDGKIPSMKPDAPARTARPDDEQRRGDRAVRVSTGIII